MAAGTVMTCVKKVVDGELDSAFALVRPPGHHAEADSSMGFCIFNSAAVAAQYARTVLGLERVAILDWDVHHGNGTQHIFESDPTVMYLSVHKGGSFYPGTGKVNEVGVENGKGFTVNCPFLMSGMGDNDYVPLFRHIFVPIMKEFNPQLVIVSAGFDCAAGDLIGPMRVSIKGFAHMMQCMLEVAPGRVVCALEGGYDLASTAAATQSCIEILLGESLPSFDNELIPRKSAFEDMKNCIKEHAPYWKCMKTLETSEEWTRLAKQVAEEKSNL